MSKCVGCGVKIQYEDENALGYSPKKESRYCQRCFKIRHYNLEIKVDNVDNSDIINKINKLKGYTLFVTDLLSINDSLINTFKSIKNNKALIINKCEILPKNLKLSHLEANIKRVYDISDEVIFISVRKSLYLNKIIDLIQDNKIVIMCGETGSGKSSLINKLFGSDLTTSEYDNTTLDFIKIKGEDNTIVYDTPGLIINSNKLNYFFTRCYTFKLNNKYVLKVDDLLIYGKGVVTLYLNQHADRSTFKRKVDLEYTNVINKNSDIIINNGFIFVKANANIKSNKELLLRDSIIKQ